MYEYVQIQYDVVDTHLNLSFTWIQIIKHNKVSYQIFYTQILYISHCVHLMVTHTYTHVHIYIRVDGMYACMYIPHIHTHTDTHTHTSSPVRSHTVFQHSHYCPIIALLAQCILSGSSSGQSSRPTLNILHVHIPIVQ